MTCTGCGCLITTAGCGCPRFPQQTTAVPATEPKGLTPEREALPSSLTPAWEAEIRRLYKMEREDEWIDDAFGSLLSALDDTRLGPQLVQEDAARVAKERDEIAMESITLAGKLTLNEQERDALRVSLDHMLDQLKEIQDECVEDGQRKHPAIWIPKWRARLKTAEAEIAALREGLRPFADLAAKIHPRHADEDRPISMIDGDFRPLETGDFRRAAPLLSPSEPSPDSTPKPTKETSS